MGTQGLRCKLQSWKKPHSVYVPDFSMTHVLEVQLMEEMMNVIARH